MPYVIQVEGFGYFSHREKTELGTSLWVCEDDIEEARVYTRRRSANRIIRNMRTGHNGEGLEISVIPLDA